MQRLVVLVHRGDAARPLDVAGEEARVGSEVVVLDPGLHLCRLDPSEGGQRLLDPVLQQEVVGHREPVVAVERRAVAEDRHQRGVLRREVPVPEHPCAAELVGALVHQGVELEVLVAAPLLRLDRGERRREPRAAPVEEVVAVAQELGRAAGVAVQQRVRPQRAVVGVARAQLGQRCFVERAVPHPPRDLAQLEALHVVAVEELQHLGGRALLADVLPRRRVERARLGDDLERAGRDERRELAVLGGVRGVVRVGARRREVERVLQRLRRVGRERDLASAREVAALQRHRALRHLQQHLGGARRGRRVGDDDLAAVADVDEELTRDERVAALAALPAVAVVEPEEVLAQQQRRHSVGRLGRADLLAHDEQRARGLHRGDIAVCGHRVLTGFERQVDDAEREHDLGEAAVGLRERGGDERPTRGCRRVVDPELVDVDQVRRRLLHATLPVVVLDEHAGLVDGAVEASHAVTVLELSAEVEVVAPEVAPRVGAVGLFVEQLTSALHGLALLAQLLLGGFERAFAAAALRVGGGRRRRAARGRATGLRRSPSRRGLRLGGGPICAALEVQALLLDEPLERLVACLVRLERVGQQRELGQLVDLEDAHRGDLEGLAQHPRDRVALVSAEPLREQDLLDQVELREAPRLEVATQVAAEQPLVQEGLVEFVGEEGAHDLPEERRVLLVEEEVQLVARVLLVELEPAGARQVRPLQEERELLQRRVLRERGEQLERLGERVEDLDLGRGDVERYLAARGDELDLPGLREVLVLGEGLGQRAGARREPRLVPRDRLVDCLRAVDRENVDVLALAEVGERDAHDAVGVRRQVREQPGTFGQVVEVGRRGRAAFEALELLLLAVGASAASTAPTPAEAAAGAAAEADRRVPRVLQRDPVEQQRGPLEHVARVLRGVASIEDVAVLLAQLAAGVVGTREPVEQDHRRAGRAAAAEAREQVLGRNVARGDEVHARRRRRVGEADEHRFAVRLDLDDVQRRLRARRQRAVAPDQVAPVARAARDAHVDLLAGRVHRQLVVAGFEPAQLQEPSRDREAIERVAVVAQQGQLGARRRGLFAHIRQSERLADDAVQLARQLDPRVAQRDGRRRVAVPLDDHFADPREPAELDAAVGVGLQRDVDGVAVVLVSQVEPADPAGQRLAALAAELDDVSALCAQQQRRAGLGGRVDAVDGDRVGLARQGDGVAVHALHAAAEGHGQRREPRRHPEAVRGLTSVDELQVADLLRGRLPVEVGGDDLQERLLQQLQRDRVAAQRQLRAQQQLGGPARQHGLAIHVDPAAQPVGLAAVRERRDRGPAALPQDDLLLAWIGREGNQDLAAVVCRVVAAAEPGGRVGHVAAGFVIDAQDLARRGRALDHAQLALVDDRAAGDAAADEVDDVGARPAQLGQVEDPAHAPHRRLVVLVALFEVGDDPVELDGRVDRLLTLDVVAEAVDLEHLDEQVLHVLGLDGQLHRFVRAEDLGHRRREPELDPRLDLLEPRRVVQQRVPALGVADPREQLGLGEHALEPALVEVVAVSCDAVLAREELLQARAHEAAVVLDRVEQRRVALAHVDVDLAARVALQVRLAGEPAAARQPDVGQEAFLVGRALRELVAQPVVEHVRLERVEGRAEGAHETPQLRDVARAQGGVLGPVGVCTGLHARQICGDEVAVLEQVAAQLQALVELLATEQLVDGERAEAPALAAGEVAHHQRRQVGDVRSPQPLEQAVELLVVEVGGAQPRERAVLEAVDGAGVLLQRAPRQRGRREQRGVEPRRQVALRARDRALVPVLQAQPAAQELVGPLRVFTVAQQGLAVLDLDHAGGAAVPLDPDRQRLAHGPEVAGVEPFAAAVVVVVGRPGDQLGDDGGAVLGDRVLLLEADRDALGRQSGGRRGEGQQEGAKAARRGCRHGVVSDCLGSATSGVGCGSAHLANCRGLCCASNANFGPRFPETRRGRKSAGRRQPTLDWAAFP